MDDPYQFGYPQPSACKCEGGRLVARPYYTNRNTKSLMLIGQDPTIRSGEATTVLGFDDETSQLQIWLREVFGKTTLTTFTVYATNVVKCTFNALPSSQKGGALKFLKPLFTECKKHLESEISNFKPDYVFTFGEPTHLLFCSLLKDRPDRLRMKDSFTGDFVELAFNGHRFKYSPCLHITTFRIAMKYGAKVDKLRRLTRETFER